MMEALRRHPLLMSLVAAACLLLAAPSAQALILVQDGKRAKTTFFDAQWCNPATVSLAAPAGASRIQPETPGLEEAVVAWDNFDVVRGTATITTVDVRHRAGRPVVKWKAAPDPAVCASASIVAEPGWYSADRRFALSYRKRERVVMTRRIARNLAVEALDRQFSFFEHTDGNFHRCRRTSRVRARCKVGFFIGDGVYQGTVKSRLSTDRRHRRLLWSYRSSVLLTDEYCVFVSHQPPCHRRYVKSRRKVRTPAWVL